MGSLLVGAAKVLLMVQASQASVAGTVRDGESGDPLPDAVVALLDIDQAVVSDSRGRYQFPSAPPGPQHVTVKRIGYAPRTLHALVPSEGQVEINIALHPEPMRLQPIEVRAAIAIRGVERGDSTTFPDRGITLAAVRNHPLLSEPDVLQALGGGEIVLSAESPSGVHVRGGASDQTAYLLDGIPVFSPYHAAGTFSAWNPDALERLDVSSSASSGFPDALSGTVSAVTRTPGSAVRGQGSVSTTQARATVDGPLGGAGAGYLLSFRSGFPGVAPPKSEPAYLRGGTGDLLAKVEAPAFGGRVLILGYDSQNELDAATIAESVQLAGSGRNSFEWNSRSVGAEWTRRVGKANLRLQGWSAAGGAEAMWNAEGGPPLELAAERRDLAVAGTLERSNERTTTVAGVRIQQNQTSYRVGPPGAEAPSLALATRTPVAAAFVRHRRPAGSRLAAELALSAAATGSSQLRIGPQAVLRWAPSPLFTVSGGYARSHQFTQSLRNAESVAGNVFPVDVFVGADGNGVPVARSDQGVFAAEYHPSAGLRLGAQGYLRGFDGLLLVAPSTGEPFATDGFATGSGTARGLSLEAAVSGTRYGLVASYGWQRVRLNHGASSYVPVHGTSHLLDAGVILFPSATTSIRFGATGATGRRGTAVTGAFEWESCNLIDEGCEFGGSPRHATDGLGATRLPGYLRLDLGFRKHWHLHVAGRDASVALFGTITNLLGRRNVLTVATDPATGAPVRIDMRPRAPLVVGLDWRF